MKSGDSFFYTANEELAVALITADVPFFEDVPFSYKVNKKGEETVIWYFAEADRRGENKTGDLVGLYNQGDKFFDSHPTHPITVAVHAYRNIKEIRRVFEEAMPTASFDLGGGRTLHARVGTEDFNKAVAAKLPMY